MLDSLKDVWLPKRTKPKLYKNQPWTHWQPKLDGWFIGVYGQRDDFYVFGRKTDAENELSHELDWHPMYKNVWSKLPANSAWHGELWVPGKPASYVVTAMKEHDPALKFTVFDVPWWLGKKCDSTFQLTANLGMAKLLGCEVLMPNRAGLVSEIKSLCREYEGAIFIDEQLNRFKWKREATVDAIVTGVIPGKGKFKGMAGALQVAVWKNELVEIASVSGFTDEDRACISSSDIGRVCEVKYQYLGAGNRLRHPRFIRWRDDKPSKECTWDQLNDKQ